MLSLIQQKPAWSLASLLSIIYAVIFGLVTSGVLTDSLLFGFCVWGKYEGDDPSKVGTFPTQDSQCKPDFSVNSHLAAFVVDVILTLVAAVLYVMDGNKNKNENLPTYLATGFIILVHGLLHWFLTQDVLGIEINCYTVVDDKTEELGYLLFNIFSFVLSVIIVSFGFGGIRAITFVISFAFALIVSQIASGSGNGEYILPALFVVVHPLSCITGLLSDQPAFSPLVGKLFVVCTAVGILELLSCEEFLRNIGGHVWYDITLHIAVLASLPYFWDPAIKNKVA